MKYRLVLTTLFVSLVSSCVMEKPERTQVEPTFLDEVEVVYSREEQVYDSLVREVLATTLYFEGFKSLDEAQWIYCVIRNRSKKWGGSLVEQVLSDYQFSGWNKYTGRKKRKSLEDMINHYKKVDYGQWRWDIAYQVVDNPPKEDLTNGSLYYYNPNVANPKWGKKLSKTKIRNGKDFAHTFGYLSGKWGDLSIKYKKSEDEHLSTLISKTLNSN